MRVLVAIDSFKGSLSSLAVGEAAREGILRARPEAEVVVRPLADGGEGTVEALVAGMGGSLRSVQVCGPMGEPVTATYGIVGDGHTAVMEMSQAAGITLVGESARNPLYATTYGVGEMILDAVEQGCRHIIMGIGGSATNDGGLGMLMALGFSFTDKDGRPVSRFGEGLEHVARIEWAGVSPELATCDFRIACDVSNPLCGPQGCSAIYGPQKGLQPADISHMDEWLQRYARVATDCGFDADPAYPGAGAAGGLGFAFLTFLGARLEPGIDIVLDEIGLEANIAHADVVVTGEGRLDAQTVMGKAPIGVARLAKRHGKRVIALAGSVTEDAGACNEHGIDAFFPVVRGVCTLAEAIDEKNARRNVSATAEQVFRLLG